MRIIFSIIMVVGVSLLVGCGGNETSSDVSEPTPPSINLSGKWNAHWEGDLVDNEFFVFTVSGNTVTGEWFDEDDGFITIKNGSISGSELKLSVDYPDPIVFDFTGTVIDEDNIKGSVFVNGAGALNGTHNISLKRELSP